MRIPFWNLASENIYLKQKKHTHTIEMCSQNNTDLQLNLQQEPE